MCPPWCSSALNPLVPCNQAELWQSTSPVRHNILQVYKEKKREREGISGEKVVLEVLYFPGLCCNAHLLCRTLPVLPLPTKPSHTLLFLASSPACLPLPSSCSLGATDLAMNNSPGVLQAPVPESAHML